MIDEWGNYTDDEEITDVDETTEEEDDTIDDGIEEAPMPDMDDEDPTDDIDDNEEKTIEDTDDDVEESDEEDYDEDEEDVFEYPEYIPDELIIPEQFKNEKDELEWYKKNYVEALNVVKHDAVKKFLVKEYREHLMQTEDDYLKLKAVKEAFDGNPRALFKMYFNQELEGAGVSLNLSDSDKNDIVARQLAEEFGDDYYAVYDPNKIHNPNSLSARIYKRNNELFEELNKAPEQSTPDLTPLIEEAYEKDFKDMDKEQYNAFIEKAKSHQVSVKDLYNAINHDALMESAYKEGLIAGRKEIAGELRPQGKKVRKAVRYTEPVEEEEYNDTELDEFASKFFK